MTEKELFDAIQELNPVLDQYLMKRTANISIEQKLLLQRVYKHLYPWVNTNLSCDSCVITYLHYVRAYFDREYPLYLKRTQPVDVAPEPEKKSKKKTSKK